MREPRTKWFALFLVTAVLAWVAWAGVGAGEGQSGVNPWSPYVLAPTALLTGAVAGTLLCRLSVRVLIGLTVAVTLLLFFGAMWSLAPGIDPLGYPNANAALAIQVIGMSGAVLAEAPVRFRPLLYTCSGLALATVVANSSRVGLAVAVPTLLTGLLAARIPRPSALLRWTLALLATAVTAAGSLAVLTVVRTGGAGWLRLIIARDPVRLRLWQDALSLWEASPRTGAGPGAFAATSPLAADPDTASAHSLLLQVGAETGWVGVWLLAASFLLGLAWLVTARTAAALPAIAAWVALAVHSLVDHLVEFLPVSLLAGVVLGLAGHLPYCSEEFDVAHREPPGPWLR
ncbi:conserved membrane hypothetical protein [Nostocoides australiense Ben110]|uniref:O-antigen ligase-related domain-containing protein n=1 Tax=Nostocoides australiense Ben110 TaxID=1193182 RepID=W6JUR0_9MICO|nr:O-antigen ligase family protein [Tetrasphaera australiensis]CCH72301.1 conserved membrane hypothetical protein [Tetrasphaera australiensis Ben110]